MRLQLRRPRRDGTTDLVFDPIEFLGRLAVLVPRPRINLLLYYGMLGARAAWRAEVVPCETPLVVAGGAEAPSDPADRSAPPARRRSRRRS